MAGTDSRSYSTLSLDALVRAIEVNRDVPHALFLGAGASISSGVPAAYTCIWDWKRTIFLSHNPALKAQFDDLSSAILQDRIQHWLDAQGHFPPRDSDEEYGFYVEDCYPIPDDRRQYFQRLATEASPYLGYKLAILLAEARILDTVWTTNFDSLMVTAAAAGKVTPIEVGLDTSRRSARIPRAGELLHVALHGDYRYDALKHTDTDIQAQDADLREDFIERSQTRHLVVTGYSGRDRSIMESFIQAYSTEGTGRLYWCGYGDGPAPALVQDLLYTATESGRQAFYVCTQGFDDLMLRVVFRCLEGELEQRAREIRQLHATERTRNPLSVSNAAGFHQLAKSNAFRVVVPTEVLSLPVAESERRGIWGVIRERLEAEPEVCASFRSGHLLCLGDPNRVEGIFSDLASGQLRRRPLDRGEAGHGALLQLYSNALLKAFETGTGLVRHAPGVLRQKRGQQSRQDGDSGHVHKAVLISLRAYSGAPYLVLTPTIAVTSDGNTPAEPEIEKAFRRARLSKQWNQAFNQELNDWRSILLPKSGVLWFPNDVAGAFRFEINLQNVFAALSVPKTKRPPALKKKYVDLASHNGVVFPDPPLLFRGIDGASEVQDVNPLRGIVENLPYDHNLSSQFGIQSRIRLGLIAPQGLANRFRRFLLTLNAKASPNTKLEYLLDYPGFERAFGAQIEIPSGEARDLFEAVDFAPSGELEADVRKLADEVVAALTRLHARTSPTVTFVCIPQSWWPFRRFRTENETFDLHDYVKAYAVQRGYATQFLRELTLDKGHQCEVRWWLALATYAKAMRTPWALREIDSDTAFMGLGFSLQPKGEGNGHVVVGCSHLYNHMGLGLRYRLTRPEDFRIRRGNPFVSSQDARRMAEQARQLFFEQGGRLPRRLVVHKLTRFTKEETTGFLEGFSGIDDLDLIELRTEPSLRYINSRIYKNSAAADAFPVPRGMTVVLDHRQALLWTHGSAPATRGSKRYYKGKSRIPAPLVLVRHHGKSELSHLANEILGLSKMDWNNFDLYDMLPATISSSQTIARVGALLGPTRGFSYDYRLFI